MFMFYNSGLMNHCARHMPSYLPGVPFVFYGDAAYVENEYIMTGFPAAAAAGDPDMRRFNLEMSRVRETVEWGFQRVRTWADCSSCCVLA